MLRTPPSFDKHLVTQGALEGDDGCIGPSGKMLRSWQPPKIMQHMQCNIPYTFDCWADPFVHLHLLKSSMTNPILSKISVHILMNSPVLIDVQCRRGREVRLVPVDHVLQPVVQLHEDRSLNHVPRHIAVKDNVSVRIGRLVDYDQIVWFLKRPRQYLGLRFNWNDCEF